VTLSTIYLRIFRPQRIFCEHVCALIYQTEVVYQQHGAQRTTCLNDTVSQNIVHLCQLSGMSVSRPSSNISFVAEITMLDFSMTDVYFVTSLRSDTCHNLLGHVAVCSRMFSSATTAVAMMSCL
jgi:hypothetical protein